MPHGGSAAVLAARFGIQARRGPRPADDPFAMMDAHARKRGKARLPGGGPLLLLLAFLLALAGLAGWLALEAGDTAARQAAARQVGPLLPVLLPDGTPRFAEASAADPVAAESSTDPVDVPVSLAPSRNDLLLERLPVGRVPRVGADGLTPWQYYARPFPQEDARPRIALVVTGMGQSVTATEEAIARLPGAVSFVFTPTAANVQAMVDSAREYGHEVLLSVPMEPVGYPVNDPGANTLLTSLPDEENIRRLEATLAAFTGYVGIAPRTDSGTAFLTQRNNLRAVLRQVQRRGLLFLDLWQVQGSAAAPLAHELSLPRAISDLQIDRIPSAAGIEAQLAQLEKLAQANKVAVGFIEAQNPVSLERVANWAAGLRDRGIVLAPVSAVVNRQPDR